MMKKMIFCMMVLGVLVASPAFAVKLRPVNAVASSEYTAVSAYATSACNGAGLNVGGDWTHENASWGTHWLTPDTDPANAWIIFDLGGVYDVNSIRIAPLVLKS